MLARAVPAARRGGGHRGHHGWRAWWDRRVRRRTPGLVPLAPAYRRAGRSHRLRLKWKRRVVDSGYRDFGRDRRAPTSMIEPESRRTARPGKLGRQVRDRQVRLQRAFVSQRQPLLDDVRDLLARGNQLEDAPVNLPVAEPLGQVCVMTEVGDVQPVGQVIQHDAALAPKHAYRPRFVDHLDVGAAYFLPPVPGGGLEPELFGRRTRREQDDAGLVRTDSGLVWRALITGKQPVSHLDQTPSAGRSQACPSYRAMKSA